MYCDPHPRCQSKKNVSRSPIRNYKTEIVSLYLQEESHVNSNKQLLILYCVV